ncbi:MAG: site-2 protease family protein [Patescibacteria group bacterium]|jgi:Zn-dependent protease
MDFLSLVFYFIIVIPSSILHEYAHGWMAERLGDPTARYAGRLTLDPRSHIDLWGTIILPITLFIFTSGRFMFAYAKPVPYNPYNLKNQRWGPALVGIAGPLANLLLAVSVGAVLRFIPGSYISEYLVIIIYINIMLMVFNLVPIPPLDGSKILYAILPDSAYKIKNFLDRYGFMILMFFIFFMFQLISPIIDTIFNLIVR